MRRRVLVLTVIPHSLHMQVCRGVARYAQLNSHWELFREHSDQFEASGGLRESRYDGVITEFFERGQAREIIAAGIPAVNLCTPVHDLPLVEVVPDDAAITALVMEHFRSLGLRSFAVVGAFAYPFAQKRSAMFKSLADGQPCTEFALDDSFGLRHLSPLATWLRSLAKPVGIFAVRDIDARAVLQACRAIAVPVPEQVAVVGVDNDITLCEGIIPPLSSIDLVPDRVGYEAAKQLDLLMDGRRPPSGPVLVPPGELIRRLSSDLVAIDDPLVARAMRFIRERAADGIKVPDVVADANLSRRVLERRFLIAVGRGPAEEIRRVRLEHAKQLLSQTRLSVAEIARACGFSSANYFTIAFTREVGSTPSGYLER